MSYESSKHKIASIYNQEIINQQDTAKLVDEASLIRSNLVTSQTSLLTKKVFYSLDTEFEDLLTHDTEAFDSEIHNMYKEWRIALPNMPLKFLPFIVVNFICQDNSLINFDSLLMTKGYFYQFSEIDENQIAKNLALVAGINVPNVVSYLPLKVKLTVAIYNPDEFI